MQCPAHKTTLTQLKVDDSSKVCQICSRRAKSGCSKCGFLLCGECRICNARHFLVKVVQLEKRSSSYHGNRFSCNICSKDGATDDDGIWHCDTCKYDICKECCS